MISSFNRNAFTTLGFPVSSAFAFMDTNIVYVYVHYQIFFNFYFSITFYTFGIQWVNLDEKKKQPIYSQNSNYETH